MTQTSLWQEQQQTNQFAELCNALYERELSLLADMATDNAKALQGRLRSLPYYVQKAAHAMVNADTPLELDAQNGLWSTKQSRNMPLTGQADEDIWQWYQASNVVPGLVVPIKEQHHIVLDCVDRIDTQKDRFRTNAHGWFSAEQLSNNVFQLLKPTKKVMMASCAGHTWQENGPCRPIIPSLRELLLSCTINWKNLKKPLPIKPPH